MKVLLVEPYFGGSHRAWAQGYAAHSGHQVSLLTMPARFWTWRMRGAALTLALRAESWVRDHGQPDLILATSMLDVAAFLGASRRALGSPAVAVYFHETQFTYPWSAQLRPDLQYAYTNWSSMAASDLVIFNSAFHRDVAFDELPRFLRRFPDFTHEPMLESVIEKSHVAHVGVDLARLDRVPEHRTRPPLILWNQRWEHDKNPAEFFASMLRLAADGIHYRLAVCGENFREHPEEFEEARTRLSDRIVTMGYLADTDYVRLLRSADVVVSTALQEFFGIAVVEAIYAGAFPVLPDRLAYPELIPDELHSRVLYESEGDLDGAIRHALTVDRSSTEAFEKLRSAMAGFGWSVIAPRYDDLLRRAVG